MDEALNAMLLKTKDPLKVFQDNFTFEQLKGAKFHKYDFDPEIFTREQIGKLKGEAPQGAIDDYRNWASLRIKGRLLIEAYQREIYPLIKKVYHVQKNIGNIGDLDPKGHLSRPGVLDAVVEIEGHGKVLLDHKTASRPYKKGAVHASTQLALYSQAEGIDKIGFAVLVKQIDKNKVKSCKKCHKKTFTQHHTCAKISNGQRCHGEFEIEVDPQGVIQLMIEDVEPNTKAIVTQSMQDVERAIENKVFPMNLKSCGKLYGEPCRYLEYCWYKNKKGLKYESRN